MTRLILLAVLFVAGAWAAPMTYIITGTGSGSWNSQPFTDATFTITFDSDTGTIAHGTSCCSGADSTPAGTAAVVRVSGFEPATLQGNQAVFLNPTEQAAGIWHFDSPDYLTVANPAFANDDLTSTIEPTGGTTFSYVTPLPLSTGGELYFTSVHDVKFSQHPGSSGGLVSAVSVTPNNSTPAVNTTQTFTAVVADTAGASDIGGVDFQVLNEFGPGYPCWLFFNAVTNTLGAYSHGNWGDPVPIGAAGSLLTGDDCTVDTKSVTVSASGNNLNLNLPITFTSTGDGVHPWYIFLAAQNKENNGSDYTQMGTVMVPAPPPPPHQEFHVSIDPVAKSIRTGGSADYTVTVTADGELTQQITFSGKAYLPKGTGFETRDISFTFDPATITGPGSTTMHVSAAPSAGGQFHLVATARSISFSKSVSADLFIGNTPPTVTLKPSSGAGSGATFIVQWPDDNVTTVSNLNLLISPTLDGRHACWIYWDRTQGMFLANDDGASWTPVPYGPYVFPTPTPVSNSQCTIDGAKAIYNDDPPRAGGNYLGYQYIAVPISFSQAFAGGKTVYVRAMNDAGFDTGYQPLGTWTAQ
jgi:hypothetical protein